MEYHPSYGPVVPEKGWVPAPSFLLRRDRILRRLDGLPTGHLLEIGCGAGTLLHELNRRGFVCEALETSETALDIARHVNADDVVLHRFPQPHWTNRFDYLFAFEVLEHIEDDHAALAVWRSWLKPGGMMFISVPAHASKWSASDVWAGHLRRYERSGLADLVVSSGFVIEHFESYGFPLANMLSSLRARVHARDLDARRQASHDERAYNNELSGIQRKAESTLYPFLNSLPGRILMYGACQLQDWSAGRDWGTGYLVLARNNG
ncbi:MAG: class I SAM-dependent methyltransferase [Nitrosomonadales bacterium]|nr:class I SAM-dependent methyltransferase [Nitrosomonadales bacterium]